MFIMKREKIKATFVFLTLFLSIVALITIIYFNLIHPHIDFRPEFTFVLFAIYSIPLYAFIYYFKRSKWWKILEGSKSKK